MDGAEKPSLKPGEKGFAFVILALALFMLYQSAALYLNSPDSSGPAIMPLIASIVVLAAAVFIIAKNISVSSEKSANIAGYIMPANVAVAIAAIVVFCLLIRSGSPFFAVTPVFLWGLMTFYNRGNWLKNVLWTAICVAFMYLVFGKLFNVLI